MPGLVCDLYNDTAVLQFDGMSPFHFWDQDFIAKWLLENNICRTVYHKPRNNMKLPPKTWGDPLIENTLQAKENGLLFEIDIVDGQKRVSFWIKETTGNIFKELRAVRVSLTSLVILVAFRFMQAKQGLRVSLL